MKQVPLNIVISIMLLGAVFFVAYQGSPYVNASAVEMPGIMVDGFDGQHLRLHGFGFRPGSLVNLELKERTGGQALGSMNVWVDTRGTFVADFDLARDGLAMASLDGRMAINWNDWMVLATGSTGSFAAPLKVGPTTQQ